MMIQVSQSTSTNTSTSSGVEQSSSSNEFEKLLEDNSSSSGTDTNQSDTPTTQTETQDNSGQSTGEGEITDSQRELMAALMMTPEFMYRTVEDIGEFDLKLEQDVVEETPEIDLADNGELNLGDHVDTQMFSEMSNPETDLEQNLGQNEETTDVFVLPEEVVLEETPEEVSVELDLPEEVVVAQETSTDDTEEVTEVETVETEKTEVEGEENHVVQPVKSTDDQEQSGSDSEFDAELLGQNQQSATLFDKVESAPIKVAETVNTQDPDMDTQMAKIIQDANDAGESSVIIRMSPESLGSVTAQITQTAEGTLHVVLQAADDVATALLKNHVSQLVQAFQAAGQTVTVEIARSEEAEQSNQDQQNAEQQQKQDQQQKDEKQDEQEFVYNDDFMQQLRLGLAGFNVDILEKE